MFVFSVCFCFVCCCFGGYGDWWLVCVCHLSAVEGELLSCGAALGAAGLGFGIPCWSRWYGMTASLSEVEKEQSDLSPV